MSIPFLRHPIASLGYMKDMIVPSITLYYLSVKYKETKDEQLIPPMDSVGADMKQIIHCRYNSIAPERKAGLINDLENALTSIKKSRYAP